MEEEASNLEFLQVRDETNLIVVYQHFDFLMCFIANLPIEKYEHLLEKFPVGVYFGWACVNNSMVFPMAMSVGWNPFFKNTKKTIVRHMKPVYLPTKEIHIIHQFENDFYGEELRAIAVGYIRPELDFKFQLGICTDTSLHSRCPRESNT